MNEYELIKQFTESVYSQSVPQHASDTGRQALSAPRPNYGRRAGVGSETEVGLATETPKLRIGGEA